MIISPPLPRKEYARYLFRMARMTRVQVGETPEWASQEDLHWLPLLLSIDFGSREEQMYGSHKSRSAWGLWLAMLRGGGYPKYPSLPVLEPLEAQNAESSL